jgi:hypothetical protein
MNLPEANALLRLRLDLTEQRYSNDTAASWAEAMHDISGSAAKSAILALARDGSRDISPASIHTWLREQRNARKRETERDEKPEPPIEAVEASRAHTLLAEGIIQGRAERLRTPRDAASAKRIRWYADGHHGHWPGCPCDQCKHRVGGDAA